MCLESYPRSAHPIMSVCIMGNKASGEVVRS